MKTLFCSLMGLVILSSTSAQAQMRRDNWPNWYIGVHGEMDFVSDADTTVAGAGIGDIDFASSYGIGANLGYRPYFTNSLLDNMRFEGEFFYRVADFDNLQASTGSTALQGGLDGRSLMFNAYYDVDTGSSITPYIGGGVGLTWWSLDSSTLAVSDDAADAAVFSYQAMAGLYFSPRSMPQTDWGMGYRYFGSGDPEFTTASGTTLEHDYSSHNLEFFGRFHF